MKNLLPVIIVFIFSISNVLITDAQEIRNVTEFNCIKVSNSIQVVISQSEINAISIIADQNILSKIKTEVSDSTLNIDIENDQKTEKPVIVNVSIKTLNKLFVSGSSEVKTTNQLDGKIFFVESNSSGNILLELNGNTIKTKLNNIGDITLIGTVQKLDAELSGAGDLRASNLEVDTATIKIAGTGSARINVKRNLTADIIGNGSVIYKGNPVERNIAISGNGSVRESKSGNGDETANDTASLKLGRRKFIIVPDENDIKQQSKKFLSIQSNREFKNWLGIELGINGLLNSNNSLNAPDFGKFLELNYAKSLQFGINLLEKDFHLYKNYLNIVTGLGLDFNHYSLQKNSTLITNTNYLSAVIDSTYSYKKNTLNISYIKAPLLLELNTNKNYKHSTHIAVGVEVAYRIFSVLKQKKELNNKHYKTKERDDFNIEPFRYSAVARIGYRNFTVFANYGINRLFKKNRGPQVYPFIVGITINFKG